MSAKRVAWCAGIWLGTLVGCLPGIAAPPVERATVVASYDLIDGLLEKGMFQTAAAICQRHLDEAEPESDAYARWLIDSVRVQITLMLRADPAQASPYIEASQTRLDDYLNQQPNHRRAPWIKLQRLMVDYAVVRREILMAAVKPADDPLREQSLRKLVKLTTQLQELSESIEAAATIERNRQVNSPQAAELVSLALQIAIQRVSAVLLRGELFDEGSADYVAAASDALVVSQTLLQNLPAGAAGRDELQKQVIECLRRTGELEQAQTEINEFLSRNPDDVDAIAIAARLAIQQNDLTTAETLLQPLPLLATLESELVRLQWLIAQSKSSSDAQSQRRLADLVQQIGVRFGDYARRRAEQQVLRQFKQGKGQALDPRILIAQAADQLRAGNGPQAAESLAAYARAADDPAAAISLATAAAAIHQQLQAGNSAAAILRETALAHFQHPESSKLHLQAAVLMADRSGLDATIEQLEEGLSTWPQSVVSTQTIDWLTDLYEAKQEPLAAAQTLCRLTDPAAVSTRMSRLFDVWVKAISTASVETQSTLANQAIEQLRSSPLSTEYEAIVFPLAALFQDPHDLSGVEQKVAPEWSRWLTRLRRAPLEVSEPLPEIPPVLSAVIAERLRLDGQAAPIVRAKMAKLMIQLLSAAPSLALVQAYSWQENWQAVEARLNDWLSPETGDLKLAAATAEMLAASDSEKAQQIAFEAWNTIAAGLPQGSTKWHEAKLATIRVLKRLGRDEAAKQLRDYVLLTQPPQEEVLLQQYRETIE